VCDFLRCSDAQKVNEATHFVFVQFTEQEHGLYDHSHPYYARGGQSGFGMGKNFT
jgi:hypothetical protein